MQVFEPQVRAVLEFDETQIAKRRQLGAYPGGGVELSKSRGSSLHFVQQPKTCTLRKCGY